jgi:hypothetical protein
MSENQSLHKNLVLASRIVLSILFMLSAAAKLYPSPNLALAQFELKQLVPMGFSEGLAAYFSRTLIGCELALGILLLQPHFFKKLVLPMSFLILFVFSAHLTYEMLSTGNEGNCGCFGALLPMTPLQAVLKNIIAMGLVGYAFWKTDLKEDKTNFSLVMAITLGSILLIYLVGPMSIATGTPPPNKMVEEVEKDTTIIINDEDSTGNITPVPIGDTTVKPVKPLEPKARKSGYANYFADIDKGRKILCFFAPGCDHCQEAAKQLTAMKKQIKDFPPIRILFMDEETDLIPKFFEIAGSKYSYQVLDIITFMKTLTATKDTPGVFYYWNGNLIKEYEGISANKFNPSAFKKIVKKSYEELSKK